MIPFNRPPVVGSEMDYLRTAIEKNGKLSGDGDFTKACHSWIQEKFAVPKALLTPSCTAALELAALLIEISPGDEVIMPSYTFVSTANAFVLRGAQIVFVDVKPDTMNIDENLIEAAITRKTKAIVPVHYAGVGCEMDQIREIASERNLAVIEDAAQGVMARYKGQALGALSDLGCFSFHDTKNYTAGGEGGALLIGELKYAERAEIIREKGTNRSQFLRGAVDKYTWREVGSSFLLSDLQAAFLLAQLERARDVNNKRLKIWNSYHEAFADFEMSERIKRPFVPSHCEHNGHMYYLKLRDIEDRQSFIQFMAQNEIQTPFHYVPLHSSEAGARFGRFSGRDIYTTRESERLVRLPIWYNMDDDAVERVIHTVRKFL